MEPFTQVAVRDEHGLAITSPQVGSTITAPPRPYTTSASTGTGKSAGNALPGMYCGTEMTKAPDSIAMCRIEAIQPSESSAVGATQICGAPW